MSTTKALSVMHDDSPGRPTIRTPENALSICTQIAEGESLRTICQKPGMPSYAAVNRWLADDEDFRRQYACAREIQADYIADECKEIADNCEETIAGVSKARLQIDARQWHAGKLAPKKYGTQKAEVEHKITGPTIEEIAAKAQSVSPLLAARGRVIEAETKTLPSE